MHSYPATVRERFEYVLALTPVDMRQIDTVRADRAAPYREIGGHALRLDSPIAVCGANVSPASPKTDFMNDHLDEQWGPIRLCRSCSLGVSSTDSARTG